MPPPAPIKVLFVCMGNICRSPTAHGVFRELVAKQGLADSIKVDSAGTHNYHAGNPPDSRSQAMARVRGVDLSKLRARRFVASDFVEYDYVIGMDHRNMADMRAIQPADARARLQLMLEYSDKFTQDEVPDPYFGEDGFEHVFDMIDDAARGLLEHIRREHGL
jgi:protein-tyrosine phosphatase